MSVRPTKRAAALFGGAILLFLVGTSVQAGWVLAVAALLLGMLTSGAIIASRALNGIEITRTVPRTASAGQPLPVTISIANKSRTPRAVLLVSDQFCGRGSALVRLIRPGERRDFRDLRDECRRGVYHDGPASIETGFPFGVLRVRRRTTLPSELVVFPRVYTVPTRVAVGSGGWRSAAAFGDVSSVRDYHPGDPLRNIHWRSVAKRGELVVREFDHEQRAESTVVASVPADADAADVIASIATSLALAALRDAGEVVVGRERVRTGDAVLEWGARLDAATTVVMPPVRTSGVICVATPDDPIVQSLPVDRSNFVVLVGEDASSRAAILRASGASVATLRTGEVE
ncbi:MAG: DUF58 domain-containing protein, partial [Actinobacteria bacterium]|nr:DUF58 domain-containing protein [Actinomycetota bacterium]